MSKGYLALVLHAHLPFIKHPEHEDFLEERWFFEAVTDTYVPLINVFDSLIADGVHFRLTLSLSPTLICMLKDEVLIDRYLSHLDKLIHLAELECERLKHDRPFRRLAEEYLRRFKTVRHTFLEKYNKNLLSAFRKFQNFGKIEIITSCATHGYMPFMDIRPASAKAQVSLGVDTYKSVFGKAPKGIWFPECAYQPGQEKILTQFGIKYFFVETHGLLMGTPAPKYGVYSSYSTPSGVNVFARDELSSKAVWSSEEGYPGNANYREYYRDIGFDLDHNYIKPFISSCGSRTHTGIKYHRITDRSSEKQVYIREKAMETARFHAKDFLLAREKDLTRAASRMDTSPIIVSPYDAELFGHWWFEGPEWLDLLLRAIDDASGVVKTITPSEYLGFKNGSPSITPSASSWGYKGYNEMWLNGTNDWIYRHVHKASEFMTKAAEKYKDPTPVERRVLNQMAKELLLAESSDWAFIMKTGTFSDYAAGRVKEHVGRFLAFAEQLEKNVIDIKMLETAEDVYNLFENMDYKVYAVVC